MLKKLHLELYKLREKEPRCYREVLYINKLLDDLQRPYIENESSDDDWTRYQVMEKIMEILPDCTGKVAVEKELADAKQLMGDCYMSEWNEPFSKLD